MKKSLTFAATLAALGVVVLLARPQGGSTAAAPAMPPQPAVSADGRSAFASFAGGCFWCIESDFEKVPGVLEAISGYTGGHQADPTYARVAAGGTGHRESVLVRFDPAVVGYERLLQAYWRMVDPTDAGGQFSDRGHQYTTAIYYHDDGQRRLAEQSIAELEASGRYDRPIITPVEPAGTFYPAEDYHQDYYDRNSLRYRFYRYNSGRDQYLARTWGEEIDMDSAKTAKAATGGFTKPPKEELRERLTPLQYRVTQQDGTEPPFDNAYWDNKRDGIYVDVVSGEPLFSSRDKYESGTGWPSFTRPLDEDAVVERTDFKLLLPRTEVRSRLGDSHLGHVFNDGPAPTGQRYCMNSAALRFVPKEDLEKEGYGEFASLFE